MTNRECMIGLLSDNTFIDDGGASEEALIFYNISCPYCDGDRRAACHEDYNAINWHTCIRCKTEWLDSEVDA